MYQTLSGQITVVMVSLVVDKGAVVLVNLVSDVGCTIALITAGTIQQQVVHTDDLIMSFWVMAF